jgi:hypothetical protein
VSAGAPVAYYYLHLMLLRPIQAQSKLSKIQQSRARPEQNLAKEKGRISLDSLVRIETFQGVALTPHAKKYFSLRSTPGGSVVVSIAISCVCCILLRLVCALPMIDIPSSYGLPCGGCRSSRPHHCGCARARSHGLRPPRRSARTQIASDYVPKSHLPSTMVCCDAKPAAFHACSSNA